MLGRRALPRCPRRGTRAGVVVRAPRSGIWYLFSGYRPLALAAFAHAPLALAGPALGAGFFVLRPGLGAARPPLPLADAIEDFDQGQFDLPQLHVDADDLHLHL